MSFGGANAKVIRPERKEKVKSIKFLWIALSTATLLAVFFGVRSVASADEAYAGVGVESFTGSPDPVMIGERLTYTIVARNGGSAVAINAKVTAGVPEGTRFVSATINAGSAKRNCSLTDARNGVECMGKELGPDEEATVELIVRPTEVGVLENISSATADNNRGGATPQEYVPLTTRVVAPEECTIVGTEYDDELRGTPERDVICAFGGDDTVYAGDRNDVVYGGNGDDAIRGGEGQDKLVGGRGKDKLFGSDGGDFIDARDSVKGNDVVRGGDGQDFIRADRGDLVKHD